MVKGHASPRRNTGSASAPLEQWPASDRVLFERCLRGGSPYSEAGRGADWAAPTRKKYAYGYGRWLTWLSKVHPDLLTLDAGERVSQPVVEEYRQHLAAIMKPKSVASCLSDLGSMLWALCGANEFAWVQLAAKRLERSAVGQNKRGIIRPSFELVDLGFALMKEADAGQWQGRYPPAVRYRNGLMIALLGYWPIRRRNLALIEIGQHLTEHGEGYRLDFTAQETKQKRAISFILPPALVSAFRRYIQVYRPDLLDLGPYRGKAGNALWVGCDGDRLNAEGICRATKEYTKAKLGRALSPQRFRDCAATTIATEDPANVRDILAVLGHASLATSEQHYNQAGSVEAARAFHKALQKLRRRRQPHRGDPRDRKAGLDGSRPQPGSHIAKSTPKRV
jgi:integrase/recombinase XerD